MKDEKTANRSVSEMLYDVYADKNIYPYERDEIAPPERYVVIERGSDVYVETWENCEHERVQICYTTEQLESIGIHDIRKNAVKKLEKEYSLMTRMIRWKIPNKMFDEMLKQMH